ncbi:MAG: phosphatidylserine decarboxylase [Betaproteobacteria bacterium]|nr:phosphatidylserine decarboxylase [Betaproteobacteria bacterium]
MRTSYPLIAREGWPFIGISFLFAVLAPFFWGWWSLPFWLLFIFCLQFFRDPERQPAGGEKSVLAPADGRVIVVEEAEDPYLKRRALKISVFMNVFNVHSNRSPVDGTVKERWYHPGSFFNAALSKASLENERCAIRLSTSGNQEITCVQIAGLVARRILNYTQDGMALTRGQRFGFIRFGSRVDLYLPLDTKARVAIGDKVHAATSILAELP